MGDKRSVLARIFVIVAMLHDWTTRRRVHPTDLWGFAIRPLSGPGRAALGKAAAWPSFAGYSWSNGRQTGRAPPGGGATAR